MAYSQETIDKARSLYLQRNTPREIRDRLKLSSVRVVYYWATKFEWYTALERDGVEEVIAERVALLARRDHKTPEEADEFDRLIGHHVKLMGMRYKHLEAMAGVSARTVSASEDDDAESFIASESWRGGNGKKGGKRKRPPKANDVSELTADSFQPIVDKLYGFQKTLRANKYRRRRNLLKARQIGATWYFAFEAFEDAVLTGDTQIFLSASKRQALVFRTYIAKIAMEYFGIPIKGDPIRLSNLAEIFFLATNSNTAQSNSGHLYIDEYMWIPRFSTLNTVASAMTTRTKWRMTWFSTPSAKTHEGYLLWSGENWRKGNAARKDVDFPSFEEYRDGGRECPDGVWRYVVTIEDAVAGGIDDIDIDELRETYSKADFDMLYMCVFVDDKDSVFSFSQLLKCGVNISTWEDFHPGEEHPFGNREVWGGFDPARTGDTATFVVIGVPMVAVERYRVLEVFRWKGLSLVWMAEQIHTIKSRYNMTYIGIDVTGMGIGVFEMVQGFARREAKAIHYSVESKNRLVMKMLDVVDTDRIEWNEDQKEIATAFLQVKKTTTASGNAMTFVADRSNENGHADVFFAIAHAMDNEPLNYRTKRKSTWILPS
ncbi:terminase family protein [Salmonella enterica]|nr:terminase family protein [Salmonella enterica]MLT77758.1 terminase [Salmonella enterica subsp. enterica serovar Sandiego]EMD3747545.1 terminase family protein [Salmonella enterica]EMD3788491.1 terminase family protein [Salmonella enterica]EMD4773891.1 terminase family protein [Salmonella enterica]